MNAPNWLSGWDRAAGIWAAALGRACWQGGLVLLVVWLLCQGFSAMSPTLRAWLWRLAYLKLTLTLLLPVISVPILPAHPLPPVATDLAASPATSLPPRSAPLPLPSVEPTATPVRAIPSALPASARPSWTFWLSLLWGIGVMWCLVRVAGEWVAAGWLRGLSEPVQDAGLNACCLELSERFGLREPPQLMVSEGAGSPVLLGGTRPVIILPLTLRNECTPAELELVIAHELAHRSRRDLLWGWIPALGHALFFFFPIEWLAAHEYRLAQEMACDELALRTSRARVGDYGEALLKVAARHRPNLQSRLVTVGIVESSQILKRRLLAMKERGSFPARPGAAVTVIVALGMLGCLPWQLVPRAFANGAISFPENTPRTGLTGQTASSYREHPATAADPVEGEEREKALHPPAPVPPVRTPIVSADLSSALLDLHSSDGFKVIAAANRLAGAKPAGDTPAVEQALIGALAHKDGFARQAVVKALGGWGGRSSVPALIQRLDDESFAVRWAAFEVLGEKQDRRAAAPIAKWLEKDRGFASNALRKLGPLAAPAVAQQLVTQDWGFRIDLCHLLKEIGTSREIPALERLTHDANTLVAGAAAEAIQAIQERTASPGTP